MMKRILSLLAALCIVFGMSVVAFAANDNDLIIEGDGEKVYTPSQSQSQSSTSSSEAEKEEIFPTPPVKDEEITKDTTDYTGGLFYAPELDIDQGVAKPINNTVRRWAGIVITVVVNILPCLCIITVLADVCCLLFPPIMTLMATLFPIQLFSDEVSAITGVAFSGRKKDGGGASIQRVDLDGSNPFVYYVRHKFVTIFLAFLIVTLIVSGVWFKIMTAIINFVVGWLVGLV